MKRILCFLGIHNYEWSQVQSEEWMRRDWLWPHDDKYSFTFVKDIQMGYCKICGKCKKIYISE